MPIGFISAQLEPQRKLPKGQADLPADRLEGSTELLGSLDDEYAGLLAGVRRRVGAEVRPAGGHRCPRAGMTSSRCSSGPPRRWRRAGHPRAMHAADWPGGADVRLRIGMHRGRPAITETGYVGLSVHAAAALFRGTRGSDRDVLGGTRRGPRLARGGGRPGGPGRPAVPGAARARGALPGRGAWPDVDFPPLRSALPAG